jgi:hypothetical protein
MVSYKKLHALLAAALFSSTLAKSTDSTGADAKTEGGSQKVIAVDDIDPTTFTSNSTHGPENPFWKDQPGYGCRIDDWRPWQDIYGEVPKNISWAEIEAAERVMKFLRVNPCECYGYKKPCCPPVFGICPGLTTFRYPCVDCGGRWNNTRNCCPIT